MKDGKTTINENGSTLLPILLLMGLIILIVGLAVKAMASHTKSRAAQERYAVNSDRAEAAITLFQAWLEGQNTPPEISIAANPDAVTHLQGREIPLSQIFTNDSLTAVDASSFTWFDENEDGVSDTAILALPLGVTSTDQCQQFGYDPSCWKRHDYLVMTRVRRGDTITERKQVLVKTFY